MSGAGGPESADGEPLAGRHVIVAGASGGLGRACAERTAALGAELTLCSRDEAALEEVRSAIEAAGGSARVAPLDATDSEQVAEVVAAAEAHAPLWGCVHAVGGNRAGPSLGYAVEDLDLLLALNVRSTFCVLREAARGMLARSDGGRLVAISSQMGSVGYPGRAAYCATKHAVDGLVRAFGVEWAPQGVTVNAVAPTFVETEQTREMLADPEFRAEVIGRIPLGRLGEADEVAAAVTFLLSPAAGLLSGAVIPVDGGWTAW